MSGKLSGKAALVTGGSRGIGAAIAERFATDGANVVITFAGNHAAAEKVVSKMRIAGAAADSVQANAGEAGAAHKAVEKARAILGKLDIIVHNAGISEYASIAETEEAAYLDMLQRHFAINVNNVVALTKAALPYLNDGGRVIIIGSVNAHQMPFPGVAVYGASKAAVAGLARGWARDLGPRRILVNVIQPGPIDTEMNPNDEREEVKHMTAMTALKRYGKPAEIAALAAFLASDDSSFITGTTIDVDGGFSV
jgi:3-oxoacyl-[acyl-carrier protein] reductase